MDSYNLSYTLDPEQGRILSGLVRRCRDINGWGSQDRTFPVCFRLTLPCLLFPGICPFLIFIKYFWTAKNPQTLMFTGFLSLPE